MTSTTRTVGELLERDRAEEARALIRVQHARMYPGGCPHACADCRARLGQVARLTLVDGDGVGGWEWMTVALVMGAFALSAGLVWLVIRTGRIA